MRSLPRGATGSVRTVASGLVTSGSNFLVSVLAARSLVPAEFGRFAAALAISYFFVALQRSVFMEPLLATGNRSSGSRFHRRWTSRLALIAGLAVSAGSIAVGWPAGVLGMGAALLVAQDAGRYRAFHRSRPGRALVSDIVMLVVQVGGFLALYVTGRRQLVFVAVVWALSAAAGLSVLWHLGKGHEPRPREDDQEAPRDRLTGWLLGQFLFGAGLSQLLPLFVLPLIGSAAYGGLRAMDALLMPCLTLGVASMPVLLQGLRHSLDTAGRASQARSVARLCGGIGVLTAGYALALLVVSDAAVEVVYGAAYVRYVSLLPYLAAAAVVNTSVLAVGASMRVLRQGRQIFLGQLAGTAASLVVLPLLTLVHGVAGTAQALLIQTVLIAGSSVFLWWRDLGRSRAK